MELSNIPKSFWNSLSVCILILTISFVAIAWRSTSLTIEIANTKIGLSQAASDAKSVNEKLLKHVEALEAEQEQLEIVKKELVSLTADADPNRTTVGRAGLKVKDWASIMKQAQEPDKARVKDLEKLRSTLDKTQMNIQQIQQRQLD